MTLCTKTYSRCSDATQRGLILGTELDERVVRTKPGVIDNEAV